MYGRLSITCTFRAIKKGTENCMHWGKKCSLKIESYIGANFNPIRDAHFKIDKELS